MKDILIIINDADDARAINFAYQVACGNGAKLTIALTNKPSSTRFLSGQMANGYSYRQERRSAAKFDVRAATDIFGTDHYLSLSQTINISGFAERELAIWIRKKHFSLVISQPKAGQLNLQQVLNQLDCPLMLLPANLQSYDIKRAVYLTDLRYCQQPVLRYLATFKAAGLLLAHICLQGLPDLSLAYGEELFADTIGNHNDNIAFFFSHIRETNMQKIMDTLIGTLRTDLVVCVNRNFHFQQLFGNQLPERMPGYITVPVLIFPC